MTVGQRLAAFFPVLLLVLAAPNVFAQSSAVEAETARLVFGVSALPQQGDLADQVRQCLKGLQFPVIKLRAFVVGTDGIDRVRAAVEEEFKKRRLPMPALSVVIVGALPREGARMVLEAVSLAKNAVNPGGVAFVSGQPASADKLVPLVLPLIEKSMKDLQTAHRAAGIEPTDVQRVTCFVTSLQDIAEVERRVKGDFPRAALNFVQLQRTPARGIVECETIARLRTAVSEPLRFVNPEGLQKSPNYSHVALIGAKRVVFSGQSFTLGLQDADARQAFEQLDQALKASGTSVKHVAMSSLYPVAQAGADLVRKIRFEFYDKTRPPASTLLLFEGLPVANASFAVDVVAVKPD